ncbi:glycoside hydrolase family 13 protein [Thalassotalea atypica]|uniref:glycoside hydrolase family 13 protein n=1 Tax=Thalassotalea atypica TaxID=2054316 RepID=UPI002573CD8E|nr:glycoside hydrolase family 13 protein [Thalassotalea atypica]
MKTYLVQLSIFLIAIFSANIAASSYKIEHLEPAFWWVDMHENKLQILVHGKDIADLTPRIDNPHVIMQRFNQVQSNNYLFLDLVVRDQAKSQTVKIDFLKDDKVMTSYDYKLLNRNKHSNAVRSYGPSDVIYLITPDRFANGDLTNDQVKSLSEGVARNKPGGRHGGDIEGIINRLNYISDMGFTQLWLNPVIENSQPSYSYHGYSTTDFYSIDPRFGNNKLYRKLSKEAQKRDIGLIKDVVLNHGGSGHWWHNDLPMDNWYNNQGNEYQGTNHKREALHDPHAIPSDAKTFSDGWFVKTMPDLNQRNPYMANYLIQNTIWWIEYANLSGLRVDTYSYPDKTFLTEWTKRVTDEYPTINIVGEEWTTNPALVSYWQKGKNTHDGYQSYLPSLMDFPLQDAIVKSLKNKEDWNSGLNELYRALANDFLYPDPANLVVFADNHDMSRIFTQLDEDYAKFKIAMTYLLTTRGIPQVFYGTEILMKNPGTTDHGVIRTDFPGGWKGDKVNAFTGKGLSRQQLDAQKFIHQLLNWRKTASAIHTGKLNHYAPENGIYVYFRHNDDQKVMVVINKSEKAQLLRKENYTEMLAKNKLAKSILTKQTFSLEKPINIPANSAYVFEIK